MWLTDSSRSGMWLEPIYDFVAAAGQLAGLDMGQTTLLLVVAGLVCLGISFHAQFEGSRYFALPGWIFVGLYFYLGAGHFIEIEDPILIFMSSAALPICVAYGVWETVQIRQGKNDPSLHWLRGAVFWAAVPYLAVKHIPIMNTAVVWFTAWSTAAVLNWTGTADVELGAMMVDLGGGAAPVAYSGWGGSQWLLTDTLGDSGFFVPLTYDGGEPVNIGFVLGCSALQSMIVFVGALIAVREASPRVRMRAFVMVVPTIHILNVFRNAGIVWLHMTYTDWNLWGIGMFDFTHAYAAKVLSLGAMLMIAIAIFEMLPELHRHVLRVISPLTRVISPLLKPLGISR